MEGRRGSSRDVGQGESGCKLSYRGCVELLGPSDVGLRGDPVARLDAEASYTDDRVTQAECEERLGDAGHQRNDPLRGARDLDGAVKGVCEDGHWSRNIYDCRSSQDGTLGRKSQVVFEGILPFA